VIHQKSETWDVHAYDAVVVGGGVLGLSIAFELTQSSLQVLLVYPKQSQHETASLAAGAMLGAYGEITADELTTLDRDELEFRIKAQLLYPRWLEKICAQSGKSVFTAKGTFVIGNNEGVSDRDNLKRIKTELDNHNEPSEWVEPQEIPGFKPSRGLLPQLCLYIPNENSVDSSDLIEALELCLTKSSLCKHIDDEVVSIDTDSRNKEWLIITKNQKNYSTENLILSAGSKTADIIGASICAKAKLPSLYFGKGVACTINDFPSVPHTIRTPNRAFACGVHVVPRSRKRLYIGATNFFGSDHEVEKGFEIGEVHILFDQAIHQINTSLRRATIESFRYGYRPITSTHTTLVGQTILPGLFVATGTYRNGVLMAPLIAQIIAAEVLNIDVSIKNVFSPNYQSKKEETDLSQLIKTGVRDIVAILHEPRGTLPYDRTIELEKFLHVLFQMSIAEEGEYTKLRQIVKQRLINTPLNETMNRLFYELIDYYQKSP
jgi:glycine oxidase